MGNGKKGVAARAGAALMALAAMAAKAVGNEKGQGTSEYAIVVGVIVVAAVVAVLLFGNQIGQLWGDVTGKMAEVLAVTHV